MTLGGSEPPDPEQAERQAIARRLLELFPETRTQILDTENSYEVAGAVALHVRELVRRGVGAEDHRVQKLFALLNELAGRPS